MNDKKVIEKLFLKMCTSSQNKEETKYSPMVRQFGCIDNATVDEVVGDHVIVDGKIDGGASVRIVSDGDICINGRIDGKSRVILRAGGSIEITGKIDGQSRVAMFAKGEVNVRGKIDGQSRARMHGTKISIREVNGQSVLRYYSSTGPSIPDGVNGQSSVSIDQDEEDDNGLKGL